MDKENIHLAYTIGIFHDIARFEQWTKYKTFADLKSIDHGDLACEILFDRGLIKSFGVDEKFYPIIHFAVKNHNKFKIDTTAMPKLNGFDTLLHAQIIRDADKIDIAWQLTRMGAKLWTLGDRDEDGVNELVLKDVKDKRQADHKNVKTKADSLLGSISHAYDLYTLPAKQIFIREKYPLSLYKSFKAQLTPKDAEIIRTVAEQVMQDIVNSQVFVDKL